MGELILITFARHSIAESTNINESFKTTSGHLYNGKHGNVIKQNVKVVFENFSSLKGFTSSSSSTQLSFSTSAQEAAAAFEGSLAGLSPTFTSYPEPESNSSGVVAPAQSNTNRPKSFTKMLSASLYSSTAPTPNEINMPINPTKPSATIIANNKRPTVVIYPTVTPESIVIPIVSCILGFPLLALLVICCLRRRAKIARERDRRRNYDMQDHAVSLVRFSPIHRLNHRSSRAVTLRPERSLSRGFPSLELDTVVEEPSDPEQTQTDIISPDSPHDPKSYCEILLS